MLKSLPSRIYISFVWIPAHIGIAGNEKADQLAKSALANAIDKSHRICWSDIKPAVARHLRDEWQRDWNEEGTNKLHEVFPVLSEKLPNGVTRSNRRQESVMARLRIGHSWLTHNYLLKNEDQPFCIGCNAPITVKHILTECSDFLDTRKSYYTETDMYRLFREVDPSKMVDYLKEIGIYQRI